jgi:hypothetical protein
LFSANCLRVLLMKFLLSSTVRLASTQGSHVLKCSRLRSVRSAGCSACRSSNNRSSVFSPSSYPNASPAP